MRFRTHCGGDKIFRDHENFRGLVSTFSEFACKRLIILEHLYFAGKEGY